MQDKLTMVETIGGHSSFVYEELLRMNTSTQAVLLKRGATPGRYRGSDGSVILDKTRRPLVIPFESGNPVWFLLVLYHLATAKFVVIDNYIGLLGAVKFKPGVQCVQLWHAVGGFKKTGLYDKTTINRSQRAKRRFRRVYNQFQRLAIGSEALAKIHMDAFGLPEERMLRTGIPRTDLFYDEKLKETIVEKLTNDNPALQYKRVLLYAPTYRDGEENEFHFHLDFDRMRRTLGEEYIVLLRLHPAVKTTVDFETQYPGFVYDYSSYPNMNELLLIADCLITDYSSVICEYALLDRPMIFYLYDLDEYLETRGLWEGYESLVPGPVVYTTSELIDVIIQWDFDSPQIQRFSDMWNTYSKGSSSRRLLEFMMDVREKKRQTVQSSSQ
ncbi:CDP-glycerol glycerophosphotransferase family protein [Alicyclobacillus sp. SO9]|uniref:CDP-glycerol glycerophosphotransferase family protein n=1 Tax=Alicyclobacillus sp. SO9 TaxID=2665646 RepID=UPI0018E6FAA0|nr:CDP-glycerol glycerophosphotransferase family protein [Alicyclobacillus sp. SO9]QQE79064.1 CDP-glycerol glycerophosphotransferase family protein [Alicyclobacillus sp. SO9]